MVVVAGITIYAMRDIITAKVLGLAEARLAEDGFYLKHGSHELSWTRGVVLKGLSLYSDKERRSRIAVFENVGIRIPLMEWFSRDAKLIFSSDQLLGICFWREAPETAVGRTGGLGNGG